VFAHELSGVLTNACLMDPKGDSLKPKYRQRTWHHVDLTRQHRQYHNSPPYCVNSAPWTQQQRRLLPSPRSPVCCIVSGRRTMALGTNSCQHRQNRSRRCGGILSRCYDQRTTNQSSLHRHGTIAWSSLSEQGMSKGGCR
jgi:hypothetical protein